MDAVAGRARISANGADGSADRLPIMARTYRVHRPVEPVAYDCIKVIVVRDGSAIVSSEFGQKPVTVGDVVFLTASTLCGSEPEGHISVTTIYVDPTYAIEQVFWQHGAGLRDRLDMKNFAAAMFTEPAQILRIGQDRAGMLMPWLDELVALSDEGRPVESFYRRQALWFNVAHVVAPFVETSRPRLPAPRFETLRPALPRPRRFAPLRSEARSVAELLRADLTRRWTVADLAEAVYLSESQLARVFVEAYGKPPIAYLAMLRVERMARLLRTTDAPIAVIAQAAGWEDPDFAARQFRRHVGVTPSRYRAGHNENLKRASG